MSTHRSVREKTYHSAQQWRVRSSNKHAQTRISTITPKCLHTHDTSIQIHDHYKHTAAHNGDVSQLKQTTGCTNTYKHTLAHSLHTSTLILDYKHTTAHNGGVPRAKQIRAARTAPDLRVTNDCLGVLIQIHRRACEMNPNMRLFHCFLPCYCFCFCLLVFLLLFLLFFSSLFVGMGRRKTENKISLK